jgi:hypothetical protein
MGIC